MIQKMKIRDEWLPLIEKVHLEWADMWKALEADGVKRIYLWEKEADVPFWNSEIAQEMSSIGLWPVQKEKRGVIIICAGGGFMFKSPNEARPIAEQFHKRGMNAAILDYRHMPYGVEAAQADAVRAVRYLRYHADELGIDGNAIGFGGFSAGGMVTSLLNLYRDGEKKDNADPVEQVSPKPDACFQMYGSFTTFDLYTQKQLGVMDYDADKQKERASQDIILQLPLDVPPMFMAGTDADDPGFLLKMGQAWAERGVPFELHFFKGGPHGAGLYNGQDNTPDIPHTAHWFELCAEWFEDMGF